MDEPRITCVCCQSAEVGFYDLVCADCIPTAQALGLMDADAALDNRLGGLV